MNVKLYITHRKLLITNYSLLVANAEFRFPSSESQLHTLGLERIFFSTYSPKVCNLFYCFLSITL